jgi:hypothetical protein
VLAASIIKVCSLIITLMMEAASTSETSVKVYNGNTSQKTVIFISCHHDNLKFHLLLM